MNRILLRPWNSGDNTAPPLAMAMEMEGGGVGDAYTPLSSIGKTVRWFNRAAAQKTQSDWDFSAGGTMWSLFELQVNQEEVDATGCGGCLGLDPCYCAPWPHNSRYGVLEDLSRTPPGQHHSQYSHLFTRGHTLLVPNSRLFDPPIKALPGVLCKFIVGINATVENKYHEGIDTEIRVFVLPQYPGGFATWGERPGEDFLTAELECNETITRTRNNNERVTLRREAL
jgi:hypothetical protein